MNDDRLADYVDVAERILKFYERFPEGRLTREGEPEFKDLDGRTFIVYRAQAFRDPDDPKPGQGIAWEPFPGSTPFTKDSELMNVETAAWGRAIASCGIEVRRGIATAEDVKARSGGSSNGTDPITGPAPQDKRISEGKARRAWAIKNQHNFTDADWARLLSHFGISDPGELHFKRYEEFIEFCERKHPLPDDEAQDIPVPEVT